MGRFSMGVWEEWLEAVELGGKQQVLRLRICFARREANSSLTMTEPIEKDSSLRMTKIGQGNLSRWRTEARQGNFSLKITTLLLGSLVLMFMWSVRVTAQSSGQGSEGKALSAFEQTLIANEKALIEAKKKDDGASLKRIVSENFSLVGIDGRLLQQQEAIGDLGDAELVELTPYEMKVVTAGEGAAIVTYDAIVRMKPEEDQGPPPRYQHFSSVWVKQGDTWKLKFHQATAAHWGDW